MRKEDDIYSGIGPEFRRWKSDVAGGARALAEQLPDLRKWGLGTSVPATYAELDHREGLPGPATTAAPTAAPPAATPTAPQDAAPAGLPTPEAATRTPGRGAPLPNYTASTNYYNPDRPKEMDMPSQLAADSQRRFGGDAMSQLQNIMALREMTPQVGGIGVLGEVAPGITRDDLENARKNAKWHGDPEYAAMLKQIYGGQQEQGIAMDRNQVAREDARMRARSASEQNASQERVAGLNATARERGETERAKLTLANTRLSKEMDAENQMGLERFKRDDPMRAKQGAYFDSLARQADSRAKLYEKEAAAGKNPVAEITNMLKVIEKALEANPNDAEALAMRETLRARFNVMQARQARAAAAAEQPDADVPAYADGGAVNPYWSDKQSGITRGIDAATGLPSITDPNAPGGANYAKGNIGLASSGGYGSFTNSAGQKFGDISGGAPIGQAMGANRDGLKTITENQQAGAMGAFKNRAYEASAQTPGSDAYSRAMLSGMTSALEREHRADFGGFGGMQQAAGHLFDGGGLGSYRRGNSTSDSGGMNYGYANGGGINVSGKQVLGPGTEKSDSIPAVIDGKTPAALSTGEYVIPANVVRKYGTDFFDKLLAKSQQSSGKGLDTSRDSA